MEQWANPVVGSCSSMTTIEPDEDIRRWCVQKTITILANSDYYYTKEEVDHLLAMVSASGVTREQVEEMIAVAIQDKANQADLDALAQQVSANTQALLNTYTKQETDTLLDKYLTKLRANEMFANYTKVNGTTLELNAEGII